MTTDSLLESRLDRATMRLIPELRLTKTADEQVMQDLYSIADDLQVAMKGQGEISIQFAGKLWYVFMAMLIEADHTDSPEPILDAAWQYADRLRKAFRLTF